MTPNFPQHVNYSSPGDFMGTNQQSDPVSFTELSAVGLQELPRAAVGGVLLLARHRGSPKSQYIFNIYIVLYVLCYIIYIKCILFMIYNLCCIVCISFCNLYHIMYVVLCVLLFIFYIILSMLYYLCCIICT